MKYGRLDAFAMCFFIALSLAGCSTTLPGMPELAPVSGTVTCGGKPVEGVAVILLSKKGASSLGVTDRHGRYHAKYLGRYSGAGLGQNVVRMEAPPTPADGATPAIVIPSTYGEASTHTIDVRTGPNTFDFELNESSPRK